MTKRRPAHTPIRGYQAFARLVRFGDHGLIPAIIQDAKSRQVLTLCYFNAAALKKSFATGTVHLFRRSQQRLMQKGETSGHIQVIREVRADCEGKSLLLLVDQRVAACHAGCFTCYFRKVNRAGRLAVVGRRVFDPTRVCR